MPTIKLLKKRRDSVVTNHKQKYQNVYQDKRWKFIVVSKKRVNPLCERCEKNGKVVQMQEVHHVIPFETGKTAEEVDRLAFDWDNVESLCEPCHEARHKKLKNK
jgi:5-methylcytosine-specific restriction protein A